MRIGHPLVALAVALSLSGCGREAFSGGDTSNGAIHPLPQPGETTAPDPSPTPNTIDHTDTGFGISGRARTPFGGNSQLNRAVVDANDAIVAVGHSDPDANHRDTALARYTAQGALDTSFASIGWERLDLAGNATTDFADGVAMLDDGTILVGGSVYSNNHLRAKVWRFNADGSRVMTFGTNGALAVDFGFVDSKAVAIQVDGNGNAWVGIDATTSSQHAWVVARVLPNGTLDSTFGSSSRAALGLDSTYQQAQLVDLALVSGGVVLAGTMHDATMLVKLNGSGKLDTTFGGGSGYVNIDTGTQVSLYSITALYSGDLIVTGAAVSPANSNAFDLFALETKATGARETAFGNGGALILDLGATQEWGARVLEDWDGTLSIGATSMGLGILRLSPAGVPDATWGMKGFSRSSATTANDYASDLVELSDGRQVVVGSNLDNPDAFVLASFVF